MDNATASLPASRATIDPKEAAHFGALAAEWWDPRGTSAMLHKLNPVRLGFIREAIDGHFGTESRGLKPLAGKRALDAGCGAGLLCEPLARMGAAVTGVDAAPENAAAARRARRLLRIARGMDCMRSQEGRGDDRGQTGGCIGD